MNTLSAVASIHFYNLTNGLACVERGCGVSAASVRYTRIQSTHCEQHRWADVLFGAGPDFVAQLALDRRIVIHDQSEKPRMTRALWQGVEAIRCFAGLAWERSCVVEPMRGGHDGAPYFEDQWRRLDERAKAWLRYFGRTIGGDKHYAIPLVTKCRGRWEHDETERCL